MKWLGEEVSLLIEFIGSGDEDLLRLDHGEVCVVCGDGGFALVVPAVLVTTWREM